MPWKKIKVKLVGKGTEDDPYRVELPTYIVDVVDGKMQIDYKRKICTVWVPADEVDEKGKIKEEYIRKKYGGRWKKWKASDIEPTS